ncbi:MAG: hypothetical protein ACFFE4_16675 [Candidatus Thorarchaeota archaeon]
MRHYYKTHGKHCYLRSFQTKCPKCGNDVLYWECRHGSKVFFNYPPYGKLIRHFCRQYKGDITNRKIYPIIVKPPKGLLEDESLSCPICGKLFKSFKNLKDHIQNLGKLDQSHQAFSKNNMSFGLVNGWKEQESLDQDKEYKKPKFGRINIKKTK